MLICVTSDTHTRRPELPDADLLIHAGDIGSTGSSEELIKEIDWLVSLRDRYKKGIVYVPGNHDIALDHGFSQKQYDMWIKDPYHRYRPQRCSADKLLDRLADGGIEVLIDEAVEIEGIKMYGTPYTPTFYNWAFMESENELADRFKDIPEDTQILISHGPAQGQRDFCKGGNVGSSALRWVIDTRLPKLEAHIVGHIHESAGWNSVQREQGSFVTINAASLDGHYRGYNPVFTLETDDWTVR